MPDHDTILFAIGDGLQTINVGFQGTNMPLPAITAPVTIDAQNSPIFPLQIIELKGAALGLPIIADGLTLAAGSSGSTIRGLIINRFTGNGIRISFRSDDNFIEGNRIGTDWTGTQDMRNDQNGIYIDSNRNTIGGTTADKRNLISANLRNGIHINRLSNDNKIYGNYIGTDSTGTQDLGNGASGVFVFSSNGTRIGHFLATLPGAGNVISGNDGWGVILTSLMTGDKPTDNVIAQNYIGTDKNGTAPLGNTFDGVYLIDAFVNFVEENVISANLRNGIGIFDSTDAMIMDNNKVRNNKIGVDKNGAAGMNLGNLSDGIRIENASYNKIGYGGQGNVIAGNGNYGIRIWATVMAGESKFNLVESNYIGTDGTGTQAVKNGHGGILLRQADRNTIGGAAAARNIISGNGTPGLAEPGHGIWLRGSKFNTVSNNYIGYGVGQQALGNLGSGVALEQQGGRLSTDNTGDGNWIDHNRKPQIRDLTADPPPDGGGGNTIRGGPGGKIGANGGLGIDMGPEGVTLNDDNETDGVQNFPVILWATVSQGTITIFGELKSRPNTEFTVEFYGNEVCHQTEQGPYGPGEYFLGSGTVMTDSEGYTTFEFIFEGFYGNYVTSLAINPDNSMSEFSLCYEAQQGTLSQWASSVLGFSSEWSPTDWSAAQARGAPDSFGYGGSATAWSASLADNTTLEFITLGFATPVYATGVTIRETNGNGFVRLIDLLDESYAVRITFVVVDNSLPGTPVDLVINFSRTDYLVTGVRIYTDTTHAPGVWEEIDAVMLHGSASGGAGFGPESASLSASPRARAFSIKRPGVGPSATFAASGPARVGVPVTFRFTNPSYRGTSTTGFRYSFDFNNDRDFTDPGEFSAVASSLASFTFTRRGWHVVHGRIIAPDGRFTDFWTRVFVNP